MAREFLELIERKQHIEEPDAGYCSLRSELLV